MVYVISKTGKPLMPCTEAKARKLLRAGKAIHNSVNVKKDCRRLTARKTTLIAKEDTALSSHD